MTVQELERTSSQGQWPIPQACRAVDKVYWPRAVSHTLPGDEIANGVRLWLYSFCCLHPFASLLSLVFIFVKICFGFHLVVKDGYLLIFRLRSEQTSSSLVQNRTRQKPRSARYSWVCFFYFFQRVFVNVCCFLVCFWRKQCHIPHSCCYWTLRKEVMYPDVYTLGLVLWKRVCR